MRDLFDSLMLMHLCACRFCISPNGDMAGNNPNTCYWGLPSIAADDPAFPPLGYWRGFVWAPWAQLTWVRITLRLSVLDCLWLACKLTTARV